MEEISQKKYIAKENQGKIIFGDFCFILTIFVTIFTSIFSLCHFRIWHPYYINILCPDNDGSIKIYNDKYWRFVQIISIFISGLLFRQKVACRYAGIVESLRWGLVIIKYYLNNQNYLNIYLNIIRTTQTYHQRSPPRCSPGSATLFLRVSP